jgi:hypothetical protein
VLLESRDRDRGAEGTAPAGRFAGGVTRRSAGGCERVGGTDHPVCGFVIPPGDGASHGRNVDAEGASLGDMAARDERAARRCRRSGRIGTLRRLERPGDIAPHRHR